jgi:hypothetical protein
MKSMCLSFLLFSFSVFAGITCEEAYVERNSIAYDCDLVCSDSAQDCDGVSFISKSGKIKSTRSRGKYCKAGLRRILKEEPKRVCGCSWYWGKNKCQSLNRVAVDCGTYCTFEKLTTGNHCKGIYWINKKNEWLSLKSSQDGKRCVSNILSGLRSVRSNVAKNYCNSCEGINPPIVNPKKKSEIYKAKLDLVTDKTLADLQQLKTQIGKWKLCADLATCAVNPTGGIPFCKKEDIKPCLEMDQSHETIVKMSDDACSEHHGTSVKHCRPSGDGTYEAAFGCAAGDMFYCNLIKNAQDRTGKFGPKGGWYRNAAQMRYKLDGGVTFSRDQSRGIFAYLIQTKDVEAAKLWFEFISKNKKTDGGLFFNICPDKPGASPADDRCRALPGSWMSYAYLAKYIGLDVDELPKNVRRKLKKWKFLDMKKLEGVISAKTVNKRGSKSYEAMLQVMSAHSLYKMSGDKKFLKAAKIIDEASDSLNPYINFIANEYRLTEHAAWLALQYCPPDKPKYGELAPLFKQNTNVMFAHYKHVNMMTSTQNFQYHNGTHPAWRVGVDNGHSCYAVISFLLNLKN